ncbi:MAG: NAD(P)-dependent glycerol-3-phosphate dehydrogenase [Phycisphaerales bacterium]|nr:NAD(P)-dependent glycerol-3-phosphate dehydrogenase [Phycisphaerales bacterium]
MSTPNTSHAAREPQGGQSPPRITIAILGIGQMGLVCAGVLAAIRSGKPSARVLLWGHSEDEVGTLAQTRKSPRLDGFILPAEVQVCYRDADRLREAELVVSAIPVQYTRGVWEQLGSKISDRAVIISVAKGIENDTLLRPTQIIQDTLRKTGRDDPDKPARRIGCLSGPTIATELARCLPAAMIAASDDPEFARQIQTLFATSWLRVYTNPDVLGVELAGAAKNVIAIAAGIVDGLQAGNNAKSALLARGLAEISRLGLAMGASPETFFGVAGLGDLATTCFSPEGRNRSLGEHLGKGGELDPFLSGCPYVVEGVATAKSMVDLARKYRVEMPITQAVHSVLYENLDPIEAIGQLMSREQKAERVG